MSLNVLLISPQMIKDRTAIHGNLDDELIRPEIKVAQDMYILPILGTALMDKIQGDIDTTGTTTSHYKTLLDRYIIDTLVWYTVFRLYFSTSYQIWNKGVVRKQGEDTVLPSSGELDGLRNEAKHTAEYYANRLRLYLKQTATASILPEYINPGTGIDTVHPEHNSFTMPIYLGDDNCCGKSLEERYQGNNDSCC